MKQKAIVLYEGSYLQVNACPESVVTCKSASIIPQDIENETSELHLFFECQSRSQENEIILNNEKQTQYFEDFELTCESRFINNGNSPFLLIFEYPKELDDGYMFEFHSSQHKYNYEYKLNEENFFFTINNIILSKNPILDLFYYIDMEFQEPHIDLVSEPVFSKNSKDLITLVLRQFKDNVIKEHLYDAMNVWDMKFQCGHNISVGFFLLFRLILNLYPQFVKDVAWYSIQKRHSLLFLYILSDKQEIRRPLMSISGSCRHYPSYCYASILSFIMNNLETINEFLYDELAYFLPQQQHIIIDNLFIPKKQEMRFEEFKNNMIRFINSHDFKYNNETI